MIPTMGGLVCLGAGSAFFVKFVHCFFKMHYICMFNTINHDDKMNKNVIFAILMLLAVHVQALEVSNTAGGLSSKVTNLDITTLKVTGSMNAEDFYFISDNLHKLKTVDLEGVSIEACRTARGHYWRWDFAADVLPVGSFADLPVTSVTLPAGLKAIGEASFAGCSHLASITLPATVDSIADFAFAGCTSLTAIQLPASVQVVGYGAFMRCTSLASLKVDSSSRLRKLDATALMDCPALKTIKLGSSIQSIGERALAGTGISSLDLSSSKHLTEVGDWVMVLTPVTSAKMPNSLTSLGDGAFLYDSSLAEVSLGGKLANLNDYLLAGTAINGSLDLKGVKSFGDYALYNVSTLTVVELPETMTWLGTRSMAGMTGLEKLTSGAGRVPELGEEVWAGVNQSSIPLTVPSGSVDRYKAAEQWKEFMIESGWLRGDVNGDGEVNIADINALVSIILGQVFDDAFMRRADVNDDGEINISDINAVLSIIMGSSFKATLMLDTGDRMHLDDVYIQPGEERTLAVKLEHASGYSSLQCDIILPQGLTLVANNGAQGYVNETGAIDATTSRAVMYSLSRTALDDGNDGVFSITVRADAALPSEAEIVLTGILLSDADNVGWHVADCRASVTNSTGVEDLRASADRVWIEDHALCIDTRHDGTAQLVAINGTSRDLSLAAGENRYSVEPGFYVVVLNGKSYKISIR